MDKHLQALVGTQVQISVTIHATGIPGIKIINRELHGLLVKLRDLRLAAIDDTRHARRQYIIDRLTRGVLLDIHRVDTDAAISRLLPTHVEVILVVAPFSTHELQRSEPQVGCRFETGHEHAHETDGGEVLNTSHLFLVICQRNSELVPCGLLRFTITGVNIGHLLVSHIFRHTPLQRGFVKINTILEIAFILVEGIILVDILDIRRRARCLVLAIGSIALGQRVAVGAVVVFITLVDRGTVRVVIVVTIERVIVACRVSKWRERVFLHTCDSRLGQYRT